MTTSRQTDGDLFAYVDGNTDQYVAQLCTMVRQPSVSSTGEGIDDAVRQLAAFMRACGLHTRILEAGGNPAVYGDRLGVAGAPTVLVYGHYDVQPVGPREAWHSPPFEPTIRDGRVYGRGASDNKGQHLAQLLAIAATIDQRGGLPVNVKVLIEGEEEISSPTLAALAAGNRDLLAADLAYISDGPIYTGESPMVALGVRGIVTVELRLDTGRGDLHSGTFGGTVDGAPLRLARALAVLAPHAGAAWLETNLRPPSAAELAALAELDLPSGATDRASQLHAALRPSLNVSGLVAGHTGQGVTTTIPGQAIARVDLRLAAGQEPDQMVTLLTSQLESIDPAIEVSCLGCVPPARTPIETPGVAVVARALTQAWAAPARIVPSIGGTLPQYVFQDVLKVPSLLVPYANLDQANHAPNENLRIDYFIRGIKSFISVMERLGHHHAA